MPALMRGSGGKLLRGPGGLLARGVDCCCDDESGGPCCEGVTIPPLCFKFKNKTGSAACLADTPLTGPAHPEGDDDTCWSFSGKFGTCSIDVRLTFCCDPHTGWVLSCTNLASNSQPTSVSCDPFKVEFGNFDVRGVTDGTAGTADVSVEPC